MKKVTGSNPFTKEASGWHKSSEDQEGRTHEKLSGRYSTDGQATGRYDIETGA